MNGVYYIGNGIDNVILLCVMCCEHNQNKYINK